MPFPAMALVVIVLASMAASTAWRLAGNSMYFIATPSMCPSLCVGSLALDAPVGAAPLHVGETISFHPPGVTQVYTHRIVKITEHGQAISTKGIAASAPDPWTITPADVEGVTVASAWGVGWFYRALPFMTVGVAILLFFRRYVGVRDRRDCDRLISILLLAVPLAVMKPLLGAYTVSIASTKKVGVDVVRVTNTGLLPARLHAIGGQTLEHVAPGQTVSLRGPLVSGAGVPFRETASIYWTGWVVVAVVVLVPAISFAIDVMRRHYVEPAVVEEPARDEEPATTPVALPATTFKVRGVVADGSLATTPPSVPSVRILAQATVGAAIAITNRSRVAPPSESRGLRVKGGLPRT